MKSTAVAADVGYCVDAALVHDWVVACWSTVVAVSDGRRTKNRTRTTSS